MFLSLLYRQKELADQLMKILILDGYNVIYELPVLKKNLILSLEDARTALVNFIQIWVNNHAYKGQTNIVFDGADEFGSNNQSMTGKYQSSFNNSQQNHINNHPIRSNSLPTGSNIQFSSGNKHAANSISQPTRGYSQPLCSIDCSYSRSGQKADDYIICMVREIKNRSSITVVSNDNYVRGTCSSLGAVVERPSFLVDSPKLKARKINDQKSAKKISPSQEKEINEFLKEKWGIE